MPHTNPTTTKSASIRQGSPGSACPRCGEALGHNTYRTTISGGARIITCTTPDRNKTGVHRKCAEARKAELDSNDREVGRDNIAADLAQGRK